MITKFKVFEKLYPVGTRVVCVDTLGANGLKEGEVYEIEQVTKFGGMDVYKLKGINAKYVTDRFVDELEYNAKKYNL